MFGPLDTPTRLTWAGNNRMALPPDTVYVGPPSRWAPPWNKKDFSPEEMVRRYEVYVLELIDKGERDVSELIGYHLACRCVANVPCHADVLLRLANHGRQQLDQVRRRFVVSADALLKHAPPMRELAQRAGLGKTVLEHTALGRKADLTQLCRLALALEAELTMQCPTAPAQPINGATIRRAFEAEGVVFNDQQGRGRQTQTTAAVSLVTLMAVMKRLER